MCPNDWRSQILECRCFLPPLTPWVVSGGECRSPKYEVRMAESETASKRLSNGLWQSLWSWLWHGLGHSLFQSPFHSLLRSPSKGLSEGLFEALSQAPMEAASEAASTFPIYDFRLSIERHGPRFVERAAERAGSCAEAERPFDSPRRDPSTISG